MGGVEAVEGVGAGAGAGLIAVVDKILYGRLTLIA